MPKINDIGFIIYLKRYNEKCSIVKVISENNGIVSGFLKKNYRKENKYLAQVGNLVNFEYNYKNLDNRGNIEIDNIKNNFATIIGNRLNLILFNSLVSILINSINENENIKNIYDSVEQIILAITANDKNLIAYYLDFLFKIVGYLGINIDINQCAVSGLKEVYYISPKTGNCVSKIVGDKYKNKLFIIPKCFFGNYSDVVEIVRSVNILHYFMKKIFTDNSASYRYKNIEFTRSSVVKELSRSVKNKV